MHKPVAINPEIARLAQQKARLLGTSPGNEVAKAVLEEAILNLDPELDFLLDPQAACSEHEVLAQTFGVNDLVVNGRHVDVRAINPDGQVSVDRALIDTAYMDGGTLVVKLDGPFTGAVVGHVTADLWRQADACAGESIFTSVSITSSPLLDLAETLKLICSSVPGQYSLSPQLVSDTDCIEVVSGKFDITLRRRVFSQALVNADVRQKLTQASKVWSNAGVQRILGAAAVWNSRAEKMSERLAAKFTRLPLGEIKSIIAKAGETYGGQSESPAFRRAVLQLLVQAELLTRLKGMDLAHINQVIDKVFSGQPIVEAVSEFVHNKIAVQVAVAIKQQRKKVEGFMNATAEEIGTAFQQLALQPVYATHSRDVEAGVEAINQALVMLEAGELAQEITGMQEELF
jgi:hypothetical protein